MRVSIGELLEVSCRILDFQPLAGQQDYELPILNRQDLTLQLFNVLPARSWIF